MYTRILLCQIKTKVNSMKDLTTQWVFSNFCISSSSPFTFRVLAICLFQNKTCFKKTVSQISVTKKCWNSKIHYKAINSGYLEIMLYSNIDSKIIRPIYKNFSAVILLFCIPNTFHCSKCCVQNIMFFCGWRRELFKKNMYNFYLQTTFRMHLVYLTYKIIK